MKVRLVAIRVFALTIGSVAVSLSATAQVVLSVTPDWIAAQVKGEMVRAQTLYVTCPANTSVTSLDGKPVVVNYTATTDGGVAPISVTGNPASGSAFPVGTTSV